MKIDQRPFPYIPPYIEDELLFSWISRLHLLNSDADSRRTLNKLFGSSSGIPSGDLPCRLGGFFRQAKKWLPFETVDDLVTSSTLLPYHAFFLDQPHYRKTVERMIGTNGVGLKIGLGLVANRFGAAPRFRACQYCDADCRKQFGCSVLHRSHQLPGVILCAIHQEALSESTIQSGQSHRQRLFLPAMMEKREIPPQALISLHTISVLSRDALTLRPPRIPPDVRKSVYRLGLKRLGLEINGRIDWDALADKIFDKYDGFAHTPFHGRLMSTKRQPMSWIRDLCSRPQRNLHPLCHLLLIGCIFGSVKEFIKVAENLNPDDVGEDHLSTPSSNGYADEEKFAAMLVDASLSCRKVAICTGRSTTTIVTKRRALGIPIFERRKTITTQQIDCAAEMLRGGQPIAEITVKTQLSISSVYRIQAASQLTKADRAASLKAELRTFHRTKWVTASSENASASVTELRQATPATYQWLYRHDTIWLSNNSPRVIRKSSECEDSYFNWHDRDRNLAAAVRQEAFRLRQSSRRVSKTSLLRVTGQEATVRRNIARLPLLAQALLDVVEDDNAFCNRRRRAALAQLSAEGYAEPDEWRIQKASRIRAR